MTIGWLLPAVTSYLAVGTGWLLFRVFAVIGRGGGQRNNGRGWSTRYSCSRRRPSSRSRSLRASGWPASWFTGFSPDTASTPRIGSSRDGGRPAALAGALRTIDATMPEVPDRDLRQLDGGTEALYVAPLEGRAFTEEGLVSTDIFPDTHPRTAERIERLEAMSREMT